MFIHKYVVNDEEVGYVNYTLIDNSLTITKVFIYNDYRGNNFAAKMMDDFIQIYNLYNITATCSYAVNYLSKRTN